MFQVTFATLEKIFRFEEPKSVMATFFFVQSRVTTVASKLTGSSCEAQDQPEKRKYHRLTK